MDSVNASFSRIAEGRPSPPTIIDLEQLTIRTSGRCLQPFCLARRSPWRSIGEVARGFERRSRAPAGGISVKLGSCNAERPKHASAADGRPWRPKQTVPPMRKGRNAFAFEPIDSQFLKAAAVWPCTSRDPAHVPSLTKSARVHLPGGTPTAASGAYPTARLQELRQRWTAVAKAAMRSEPAARRARREPNKRRAEG